jgi:thiol:disulfide interchange protein DsbD
MHFFSVCVICFILLGSNPSLSGKAVEEENYVRAELLSSTDAVVPDKPFDVGVHLTMAPGWHTYWQYGGDAGMPTQVTWSLPEGFRADAIRWPVPERKVEPGDIWTYGYRDDVLLLVRITPPSTIRTPGKVELKAKVRWLVCKEICIPGSQELQITLPVLGKSSPTHSPLFEKFAALVPLETPPPYELDWIRNAAGWELAVRGLPAGTPSELFPLPAEGTSSDHPLRLEDGRFSIKSGEPFRGVWVVGSGDQRKAWTVQTTDSVSPPRRDLALALLNGFIGGLILNLMPCVLPVISLKIFGFIRQAGDAPGKIFAHGLAFTAGIFAWFAGLAGVVLFLKSGGAEVTWAFQFQNPWFITAIGSILFIFALNLFGVFEVMLPGRTSTALDTASSGEGLAGSFFQGMFATLLATPCTAPFLGTALGFAFAQSNGVIVAMFGAVAMGMAFPYLLLAARPSWMRFLPRPGPWMAQLKQFMAFPLLAALVWILGILGAQKGMEGLIHFLWFLLCLGLACWIYGHYSISVSSRKIRFLSLLLASLIAGGGGWYFLKEKTELSSAVSSRIDWEPFSTKRLEELRAEGRSVFVDFTADWCITCKFNERTAIETEEVRRLLREKKVVPVKADWTHANPEISAALKAFGRVGVPFYVIYPPNRREPIVLPELLTEKTVLDALKKLP